MASLITGQFQGKIFSKIQCNLKLMAGMSTKDLEDLNYKFLNNAENGLNNLNLSTVYVITTDNTASASELVINGLKPYMNVIQIGETTIGKNVGSRTVYDAPNVFSKSKINQNHKYAMQPLIFKISNSAGFGDYTSGLPPTYVQEENIVKKGKPGTFYGILGDTKEPLLELGIAKITGSTAKKVRVDESLILPYVSDSKKINGYRNEMYLESAPK